jgi:hypothetical protein
MSLFPTDKEILVSLELANKLLHAENDALKKTINEINSLRGEKISIDEMLDRFVVGLPAQLEKIRDEKLAR